MKYVPIPHGLKVITFLAQRTNSLTVQNTVSIGSSASHSLISSKKKGKKLMIVIDINGECSKPCRNCQKFFTSKLPFCKMKYKEKREFKLSNPVFIDSKYSRGFSKYNH